MNDNFQTFLQQEKNPILNFPYRYINLAQCKDISQIRIGEFSSFVTYVEDVEKFGENLEYMRIITNDNTETAILVFFNIYPEVLSVNKGDCLACSGVFELKFGIKNSINPLIIKIDKQSNNQIFGAYACGEMPRERFIEKIDSHMSSIENLDEFDTIKEIHFPKTLGKLYNARNQYKFLELKFLKSILSRNNLTLQQVINTLFNCRSEKNGKDRSDIHIIHMDDLGDLYEKIKNNQSRYKKIAFLSPLSYMSNDMRNINSQVFLNLNNRPLNYNIIFPIIKSNNDINNLVINKYYLRKKILTDYFSEYKNLKIDILTSIFGTKRPEYDMVVVEDCDRYSLLQLNNIWSCANCDTYFVYNSKRNFALTRLQTLEEETNPYHLFIEDFKYFSNYILEFKNYNYLKYLNLINFAKDEKLVREVFQDEGEYFYN